MAYSTAPVYTVYSHADGGDTHVTIPSTQKVRNVGTSLVVTIPADVAEQHNIKAEDLVRVDLELLQVVPRIRPALTSIAQVETAANVEALQFLRDN